MRLLFDQNLASRLVRSLADLYPDSVHVRDVGLASSDDAAVWEYAKQNALTIVSKDGDFHMLRDHHADIGIFLADPEAAFLALA